MDQTLFERLSQLDRARTIKRRMVTVSIVFLLAVNMVMAHFHTETIIQSRRSTGHTFYVFKPEAYELFSVHFNNLASRLNLLYALYTPVNMNIPSINFERLTASLKGSNTLDPLDISTYSTIVHFWSWVKKEDGSLQLAEYLKNGLDIFPENWEIPYSIYSLLKEFKKDESMKYLKIAAERASKYGGPEWIIDFPAILMHRDGESLQAFLWLQETYSITKSEKQKSLIVEQMKNIEEEYNGEYKENMQQVISELEELQQNK